MEKRKEIVTLTMNPVISNGERGAKEHEVEGARKMKFFCVLES